MAQSQNTNSTSQQTKVNPQPTAGSTPKRKNNKLLYIGGAVAIIVIAMVAFGLTSTPYTTVTQNQSLNTTPAYMSAAQAGILLGSQLSNYNASDLYRQASPINMSYLVSFVPQLATNATSGWLSWANGSNSITNASIEYFVLTTNNTASISKLFASSIISSLHAIPITNITGTQNGLSYDYAVYSNSTTNLQFLYGWKGRNAVLTLVVANTVFLANQVQLISIVANDTPYN